MRITKDVEYALIGLLALGEEAGPLSARQISERHAIPVFLLSKILQRLSRAGLLESVQGASGGYALARPLVELRLSDAVRAVHGPIRMVRCLGRPGRCERKSGCALRKPMERFQSMWLNLLESISVEEFAALSEGGALPARR